MSTVETIRVRPVASAPRVRRTQAERRAESDGRLLHAAAELIVERGIEGTSLAEIGRRAGYSHGLVHHRFGSKDALIERLNSEAVDLFTSSTVSRVIGEPGGTAVRILSESYLTLVHGPDPIARVHLLVWSEAVAIGSARRPYRAGWDHLLRSAISAMISRGIDDGSVSALVDAESAAVIIVGLLRGVSLQLLLDPDAGSVAAGQAAVLEHVERILTA